MCKVDVEVLWEPGNFQDDRAKRVGVCFASNTDLELAGRDNMIIFQKPFPGAARTELESQLQHAVKEPQAQAREVQDGLGALPPHAGAPGGAVLTECWVQCLEKIKDTLRDEKDAVPNLE